MAEISAERNEGIDSLLKRFNRHVQQEGILSELRRREHYEKPSLRRQRKSASKRRKSIKSSH